MRGAVLSLCAGLALVGCVGELADRPAGATGGGPTGEPLACVPGHVGPRRLSRREHARTLRDLLGSDPAAIELALPIDPRQGGFDNSATALSTTPDLLERYLDVTESAVEAALARDDGSILGCTPGASATTLDEPCIEETILGLAERAFRRPVSVEQRTELAAVYATAIAETSGDVRASIAWTLEAILTSPSFLFVIPERAPGETEQLDPYSIASRLSYFLWSTMPDDALSARARDGSLLDPAILESEVRRMLAHERAADFTRTFAVQWLDLESLPGRQFDETRFPDVDRALLEQMVDQSVELFTTTLDRGAPAEALLSATVPLDPRLGAHYEIADGAPLPAERHGLLGLGAVLAATAHPDRTSIPHRGMWVMSNLFCLAPPPPPPEGIDLTGFRSGEGLTQRDRLAMHREDEGCAGCHATMDELGFGLERFDAVGRIREDDEGMPIDDRGTLPDGRTFTGPVELATMIASDAARPLSHCLASNLLAYSLGRMLRSTDQCHVDAIAAGEPSIEEMIVRVVAGDAFTRESVISEVTP